MNFKEYITEAPKYKTVKPTKSGWVCPYCGKKVGVNEGSSEKMKNDKEYVNCPYCMKRSLVEE